jgi:C1A family cysteine protease
LVTVLHRRHRRSQTLSLGARGPALWAAHGARRPFLLPWGFRRTVLVQGHVLGGWRLPHVYSFRDLPLWHQAKDAQHRLPVKLASGYPDIRFTYAYGAVAPKLKVDLGVDGSTLLRSLNLSQATAVTKVEWMMGRTTFSSEFSISDWNSVDVAKFFSSKVTLDTTSLAARGVTSFFDNLLAFRLSYNMDNRYSDSKIFFLSIKELCCPLNSIAMALALPPGCLSRKSVQGRRGSQPDWAECATESPLRPLFAKILVLVYSWAKCRECSFSFSTREVEVMASHRRFVACFFSVASFVTSLFFAVNAQADKREMMLGGLLSDVFTNGNYGRTERLLEEALPEQLDWRNVNGIDYASPVKNQARCGSCVAFAVASTFESQMNIATGVTFQPWSFSTQHLFTCGGGSCAAGWRVDYGADYLVSKGIPEEACFPYISGAAGDEYDCNMTCSDAKARGLKGELRVRSQPILGASVEEVKQALLGGPVVATMRVYDDFFDYKSGVYRHKSGAVAGGHAVMIMGWNNAEQAWIVRNSWGTEWGDKGDFMIAWDDASGTGGKFFGFNPPKNYSGVVLEGARDRMYLREPTRLSLKAHNVSFTSATLEIRGKKDAFFTKPFDASGAVALDPKEIPDGVYTVQARAKIAGASDKISQAYIVFVRTGEAKATIAIRRIKLNMNVWETIYPYFEVTSAPVPLARIQYRLLNEAGETVYSRSAQHTADLVGMKLDPEKVKVGHYVMIAEAISDDDKVLATDRTEFNVIPK